MSINNQMSIYNQDTVSTSSLSGIAIPVFQHSITMGSGWIVVSDQTNDAVNNKVSYILPIEHKISNTLDMLSTNLKNKDYDNFKKWVDILNEEIKELESNICI